LSLGVLGSFVLFALGLHNITQSQLQKFEIQVFLPKGISETQVYAVGSKISKLQNVKSVQLITAQAGWAKFKKEMGDDIDLSGVNGNPLGSSYRVALKEQRSTAATANALRKLPNVDEVNEGGIVVNQMVHLSDLFKSVGIAIAALLFLITAFIVSNTIRLMIYSKRREIRIMQLVGATNWFIRLPLIFEGTLLGAIGGAVAYLLMAGSGYYLARWVGATFGELNPLTHFSSNVEPLWAFGGLMILGWVIGAFGSLISIQRFLKS
jgi:cell division transport system permease protein